MAIARIRADTSTIHARAATREVADLAERSRSLVAFGNVQSGKLGS
jgi:hypothetical protein